MDAAAVRAFLRDVGGGSPSAAQWAALLRTTGMDVAKAQELPVRLGTLFHLGPQTGASVEAQLRAWADGMRVRAEPAVAEQLDVAVDRVRRTLADLPAETPVASDDAVPLASPPPPAPAGPVAAPLPPPPTPPASGVGPPAGQRLPAATATGTRPGSGRAQTPAPGGRPARARTTTPQGSSPHPGRQQKPGGQRPGQQGPRQQGPRQQSPGQQQRPELSRGGSYRGGPTVAPPARRRLTPAGCVALVVGGVVLLVGVVAGIAGSASP